MQLVGERVLLFDAARDARYDEEGVRAKLGVRPAQVPDFLGLAGDAVDNIPGVPKVGPKTAAALLERFEGLEAIYAALDRVAALPLRGARSLAERLARHRDQAFLSRELATIATDAPVEAGLDHLRLRRPDMQAAEPFLEHLGFRGAIERLRARA
jgi:DNA polymerase I